MAAKSVVIQLNPNYANGPAVEFTQVVSIAGSTVDRQVCVVGDPSDPSGWAVVKNQDLAGSDYGIAIRSAYDPEIVFLLRRVLRELRFMRSIVTDTEDEDLDLDEGE
jgi:hypothetical protein